MKEKLRFVVKKIWPNSGLQIGDILETYGSSGYVCNRIKKTFFFFPELFFEFFENGNHECIFNAKTEEYIKIGDMVCESGNPLPTPVNKIEFIPGDGWHIWTERGAGHHIDWVTLNKEKTHYIVTKDKNLWTITSINSESEWRNGNFKNSSLHETIKSAEEHINVNSRLFSMGDVDRMLLHNYPRNEDWHLALWLRGKFLEEFDKRKPYK